MSGSYITPDAQGYYNVTSWGDIPHSTVSSDPNGDYKGEFELVELRFEDLLQNWTVMSRSDLQANGFNVESYDLMLEGHTANSTAHVHLFGYGQ